MAEPQPRTVHEGATVGGDVEEEVIKAKSAEDRKAAAALASMDSSGDGGAEAAEVDAAAVSKAMKNLGTAAAPAEKKEVKKVKVDPADVALLVDELELTKPKATELLKAHDGDAVRAMRAYIAVKF